nr:MAG TPA: hypothetical protein [Caudoviricetes sp.]
MLNAATVTHYIIKLARGSNAAASPHLKECLF